MEWFGYVKIGDKSKFDDFVDPIGHGKKYKFPKDSDFIKDLGCEECEY